MEIRMNEIKSLSVTPPLFASCAKLDETLPNKSGALVIAARA
jgi:hypothetical protein